MRAVDPADPALDRPTEAAPEIRPRVVARTRFRDQPCLPVDAGKLSLAARRYLVGRESVDPLDPVLARRDGKSQALAPAIRVRHQELRVGGLVAAESDEEPAVLRNPHRHALQFHRGARRNPALKKTSLGVGSIQADAGEIRGRCGFGLELAGGDRHR